MRAERGPWWMRTLVNEPSVLILHEKHRNRYFVIPDDKALGEAALHVLKERMDEGYWYSEPEEPKGVGYGLKDLESLPEVLRAEGKKKLAAYKQEVMIYREQKEWWEEANEALMKRDGKLAWKCLVNRNDYEYERVELEPSQKVKSP